MCVLMFEAQASTNIIESVEITEISVELVHCNKFTKNMFKRHLRWETLQLKADGAISYHCMKQMLPSAEQS
jgi:hypothetical protein